MSKMYTNPERKLVCEIADGKIVNGPLHTLYPKKGYLLPARVIQDPINPLDQYSGTSVYEITEDEVLIRFPAVDHPPEVRLENHKQQAIKSLGAKRKSQETGGLTVDGFPHTVVTEREAQTELTTKVKLALTLPEGDSTTFPVLTDAGYVSVDIATIKAISAALIAHVQACFSEQRAKEIAITAATTVEEITPLIS